MPKPERTDRREGEADTSVPQVTARSVSETRTVFTEENNPDGWITTDLTVPLKG